MLQGFQEGEIKEFISVVDVVNFSTQNIKQVPNY
jgi:hypothetical protein